MPDNLGQLLNEGSLLASIAGLLLYTYFIFGFAFPARRQAEALSNLNRKARDMAIRGDNLPEKSGELFAGNAAWKAAWEEFAKTLRVDNGRVEVVNPPSTYFTRGVLIDPSIDKKLFRYVPILILVLGFVGFACGAIGIFTAETPEGSEAPPIAPEMLLAVVLSFVPMSLAMAATGYRKYLPESLPPLADDVLQALASLYRAPDANEIIALAQADNQRKEKLEAEATALRDLLARVLGDVLSQQINKQTMAIQSQTATITGDIVKNVSRAMEQPLAKIVQAAEQTAKQGEILERMLKESMTVMSRDLGNTITKTFEKPVAQMVQVVEQSGRQAENVDKVLQATTAAMAGKIEAASREQIKGLNEVMHESAKSSQDMRHKAEEASREQIKALSGMLQENTKSIQDMRHNVEEASREQIKALSGMLQENAKSVQDMRQNVVEMMEDLKKNSEYISAQTRDSIEKMDASAKIILQASEKFGEAGHVMTAQISNSHSLSRHMMESGAALNGATQSLSQVITDYGKARENIAALVSTLQGMVKEVDQKVTINKALVSDMQKVADRLKEVQTQTDQYLNQVSDVLSAGFNGFGKSVHENLERSTSSFHNSMSSSVELISVQMRNLTAALEELPELLRKPAA